MAERSNATVLKTVAGGYLGRGFESHPLRSHGGRTARSNPNEHLRCQENRGAADTRGTPPTRFEALASYFTELIGYATCTGQSPWERVDLYELVRSVVKELATPDGVRVDVSSLPIVSGEEPALRVMFRALLENAIQHGGEDLSRVVVESDYRDSRWIVSIEGNGAGSPDLQAVRLPGIAAEGGWGLPTAEKVARHHGGDFEIQSIEDVGTKVIIRLPDR